MAYELVFTSVPQGIRSGSSGFCTVAYTAGMTANLVLQLESISGYKPCFPHYDPHATDNPIAFSHYLLNGAAGTYHVLSRISFYGLDYTKRSNKLAHHVVLAEEEVANTAEGPAQLSRQDSFFRQEWNGEPELFNAQKTIVPSHQIFPLQATRWQEYTGDAGWAGKLVQSYLEHPKQPAFIIFDPLRHPHTLELVTEALALLPESRRWEVSYNTYVTVLPTGVTCNWRFCLPDAPALREARRMPNALIINLTQDLPSAGSGDYIQMARTGERPFLPTLASPQNAPTPEPEKLPPAPNAPKIQDTPTFLAPLDRRTPHQVSAHLPANHLATSPQTSAHKDHARLFITCTVALVLILALVTMCYVYQQHHRTERQQARQHNAPSDTPLAVLLKPTPNPVNPPPQKTVLTPVPRPLAPAKQTADNNEDGNALMRSLRPTPTVPPKKPPKQIQTRPIPQTPKQPKPQPPSQLAPPKTHDKKIERRRKQLWYNENFRRLNLAPHNHAGYYKGKILYPNEKLVSVTMTDGHKTVTKPIVWSPERIGLVIHSAPGIFSTTEQEMARYQFIVDQDGLEIANRFNTRNHTPHASCWMITALHLEPGNVTIYGRYKKGYSHVPAMDVTISLHAAKPLKQTVLCTTVRPQQLPCLWRLLEDGLVSQLKLQVGSSARQTAFSWEKQTATLTSTPTSLPASLENAFHKIGQLEAQEHLLKYLHRTVTQRDHSDDLMYIYKTLIEEEGAKARKDLKGVKKIEGDQEHLTEFGMQLKEDFNHCTALCKKEDDKWFGHMFVDHVKLKNIPAENIEKQWKLKTRYPSLQEITKTFENLTVTTTIKQLKQEIAQQQHNAIKLLQSECSFFLDDTKLNVTIKVRGNERNK